MIDHQQQLGVDLVALRQSLVEVHRTHHRAQVGSGQLHDRDIKVGNLIGRLAGIENLEKHHRVDADHGVVLGDDFLSRNIEHLLHHVDLVADAIDKRDNDMQARRCRQRELAQAFDGVDKTLPHDAHTHEQKDENHHEQREQSLDHYHPPIGSPRRLAPCTRRASITGAD